MHLPALLLTACIFSLTHAAQKNDQPKKERTPSPPGKRHQVNLSVSMDQELFPFSALSLESADDDSSGLAQSNPSSSQASSTPRLGQRVGNRRLNKSLPSTSLPRFLPRSKSSDPDPQHTREHHQKPESDNHQQQSENFPKQPESSSSSSGSSDSSPTSPRRKGPEALPKGMSEVSEKDLRSLKISHNDKWFHLERLLPMLAVGLQQGKMQEAWQAFLLGYQVFFTTNEVEEVLEDIMMKSNTAEVFELYRQWYNYHMDLWYPGEKSKQIPAEAKPGFRSMSMPIFGLVRSRWISRLAPVQANPDTDDLIAVCTKEHEAESFAQHLHAYYGSLLAGWQAEELVEWGVSGQFPPTLQAIGTASRQITRFMALTTLKNYEWVKQVIMALGKLGNEEAMHAAFSGLALVYPGAKLDTRDMQVSFPLLSGLLANLTMRLSERRWWKHEDGRKLFNWNLLPAIHQVHSILANSSTPAFDPVMGVLIPTVHRAMLALPAEDFDRLFEQWSSHI